MNELVFFLEELSAEAMLKGLLPRLLPPEVRVRYVVFEGKQDLEKRLARHLRANCRAGARCVVLRDQDSADCTKIKRVARMELAESGVECPGFRFASSGLLANRSLKPGLARL